MWFRVDDHFASHPKLMDIATSYRNEAAGLWLRAGCWSSQFLTDGYIARNVPQDLYDANNSTIGRLERSGLWIPAPDGHGWQMHDWDHWQPTRAQLDKRRDTDRKRKRQHRESTPDAQPQHQPTDGRQPVMYDDPHCRSCAKPMPAMDEAQFFAAQMTAPEGFYCDECSASLAAAPSYETWLDEQGALDREQWARDPHNPDNNPPAGDNQC